MTAHAACPRPFLSFERPSPVLLRRVAVFVAYMAVLGALFAQSPVKHYFSTLDIPLSWTLADIETSMKGNDIGATAETADYWLHHGKLPGDAVFYLRMWAPGSLLTVAASALLSGGQGAIPPFCCAVLVSLWAMALAAMYGCLKEAMPRLLAFMLPLLIFILPEFSGFMLRAGMMNSDPFGGVTLALAVAASWRACREKDNPGSKWWVAAGAALAATAYYRAAHNMLVTVSAAAALCWVAYYKYRDFRGQSWKQAWKPALNASGMQAIARIVLLAVVLMLPYRLYLLATDHRISWSTNMTAETPMMWRQLTPADWFYNTGLSVACRVDLDTCKALNSQPDFLKMRAREKAFYTVRAFVMHPFAWIGIKAQAFYIQWMTDYGPPVPGVYAMRLGLLALFLLQPFYSAWRFILRRDEASRATCWISASIMGYAALLLLAAHIEGRYLFPFKLTALCLALLETANALERRKAAA